MSTGLRHLAVLHSVSVSTFPYDRPLEMDVFYYVRGQTHSFSSTWLFRYFSASHAKACGDDRADQRMSSGFPGAVGGSPGQSSSSI